MKNSKRATAHFSLMTLVVDSESFSSKVNSGEWEVVASCVPHPAPLIPRPATRLPALLPECVLPRPTGPGSPIHHRVRERDTMEMESLKELYVDELKDLYSAEKQLVKALPKMAKNATNPELQQAFTQHLEETEGHVERLEQIFEMLGERAGGKKCKGMEGLIEEAKELLEEDASEEVLDAGMISKAQHVEHYEIAGYGTVRTYARQLGFDDQAELLQETLDEEGKTDE